MHINKFYNIRNSIFFYTSTVFTNLNYKYNP